MNNLKERRRVMDQNYEKTSLVDRVFSWSIKDILNRDLHKHKVYIFLTISSIYSFEL